MTQREKTLTAGLLGVLAVFGGGFLFHLFVYEPVTAVREQLETERDELQKKKNELLGEKKRIDEIFHVDPRLTQWTQISLPPRDPELKKLNLPPEEQKRKHLADLRVAYEDYLSTLMTKAGFLRETIKVEVRASGQPRSPVKGKEPPYEQLTFGAVGQGKMDSVVRMMREFHRTPLLHHVRNVSLGLVADNKGGKKTPGLLELNLTVEALLMNGAEDRSTLQPKALAVTPQVLASDPKKPAAGERNYLAMNRLNMFTGYSPTPEPVARTAPAAPKVSTEEKAEVLRFVKLTTLAFDPERKRWEGWLYDQAKGGKEKKVNTGVLNEFTISDKDDHAMIEAKVVKIDEEFMVILSEGKYYRLRCGDFLYPAIRKPMSKAELKEMGITPDESEKEKKKEKEEEE
jgi:hypothetical protein